MTAPRKRRLRLDGELCEGHGRCYELAPDLFGEDERGHCRILCADVPPELEEKARLGVANCPEGALQLDE